MAVASKQRQTVYDNDSIDAFKGPKDSRIFSANPNKK